MRRWLAEADEGAVNFAGQKPHEKQFLAVFLCCCELSAHVFVMDRHGEGQPPALPQMAHSLKNRLEDPGREIIGKRRHFPQEQTSNNSMIQKLEMGTDLGERTLTQKPKLNLAGFR